MARAANTYSLHTRGAVDTGTNTQSMTLRRYASTTDGADWQMKHWGRRGTSSPPTGNENLGDVVGVPPLGTDWKNWTETDYACDTTYYWRCYAEFYGTGGIPTNATKSGTIKSFLTNAAPATAGTASANTATSSSIKVDTTGWIPATNETTASLFVQYKTTLAGTWADFGSAISTGTGYVADDTVTITTVTGLTAETSYDFRTKVTRAAAYNTTEYFSATDTLSTIADTPSVTTDAATSVAHNTATLNGTVDHNTVDGALSWRYILTASYSAPPDDAQGTEVAYASNPITEDGSGSYGISGLTASTGYTFWAIYDPTGAEDTVFGAAATFTTAADPAAEAADEDHMITQYVDGQYGVATTVYFALRQPAATSSDNFYTGTAPVQADVKILQDGVYDSTSDNAPAQEGTVSQMYSLVVSAAEMAADVVDVMIVDAAGSAFRDHHIQIRTQQNLGTIVVNAASKATNTDAVTYTGNGTGAGLKAVGGDNDGMDIEGAMGSHTLNYGTLAVYNTSTSVDLDNSTAVATNDHYNGAIFLTTGGTGAGQARTIIDYDGASYAATLNKALAVALDATTTYIIVPGPDSLEYSPVTELAALPTKASTYAQFLQFLFQRFAYERDQTAVLFQMKKEAGGASVLASNAVDDDGTTQTHDALS